MVSVHPRSRGRRRRRRSRCRLPPRRRRDIDSEVNRRSSCLCVGCSIPRCRDTSHRHDHQQRTTCQPPFTRHHRLLLCKVLRKVFTVHI